MRKTLTLLLFLTFLTHGKSQSTVEIHITGISPEVEQAIIPGDVIVYGEPKGIPRKNVKVVVKTILGEKNFFGILDATPDDKGHYTIDLKIPIKESSSVSFDDDIELLITTKTIYNNVIWTKVIRTKENLSDPIILDNYNSRQESDNDPRSKLFIDIHGIAYDQKLQAEVKQNQDDWKGRDITDFHIQMKNKGDEKWKIDQYCEEGDGRVMNKSNADIYVTNSGLIDLSKRIVIRTEVKTEKGNVLWNEVEIEAREMSEPIFGMNYKVLAEGEWEKMKKEAAGSSEYTESDIDESQGNEELESNSVETNSTGDSGKENADEDMAIGSNETDGTKSKNNSNEKNEVLGTIDLTTKTVLAQCAEMKPGDTLININGSNICVNSFKAEGAKAMVGILSQDVNIELDGQLFPLKGGEPIKVYKSTGKLMEGILRAETNFNSSVGDIMLREGSLVMFNNDVLIAGQLSKNTVIKIGEEEIEVASNTNENYDIRFDNKGRILEFTIVGEYQCKKEVSLVFPMNSRLIYKDGQLKRVVCLSPTTFDLNGNMLNVKGDKTSNAYEFDNDGNLVAINSDSGNTILVEDQAVVVEEGSEIKFIQENGSLVVEKFFVKESVKVNVYKGKGVKAVTVKPGKRIVFSEGKVVKAG